MRFDHLHHHYEINRRQLLSGAAKLGAGAAVAMGTGGMLAGAAGADDGPREKKDDKPRGGDEVKILGRYNDDFDVAGALDGTWAKETSARYGKDDQRGSLNEITPRKTARALKLLEGSKKVVTHNLGHLMVDGAPGYVTFPPRRYSQRLTALGYTPKDPNFFSTTTPGLAGEDEWRAADRTRGPLGYLQSSVPSGTNTLSGHEERFLEGGTYQIMTQLDNLPHIGVKEVYYNGFRADDFATPLGVSKLGLEHVGPIVTRGILLDVLGWKQSRRSGDVQTVNGNPMLADTYRITLEDLLDTMKWEGIKGIEAGDVVLIRTGWDSLADDPSTYDRYLATEPGIYLREAKYLGDHRPAVIGADSWALEIVGVADPRGYAFAVHQELIPKRGIRIGEAIRTNSLAAEGAHEFVYCYMPQHAWGATAGNTPPMAMTRG
ncbi:MAG: cyclase family protein [Acidimicrobiales bacterium]